MVLRPSKRSIREESNRWHVRIVKLLINGVSALFRDDIIPILELCRKLRDSCGTWIRTNRIPETRQQVPLRGIEPFVTSVSACPLCAVYGIRTRIDLSPHVSPRRGQGATPIQPAVPTYFGELGRGHHPRLHTYSRSRGPRNGLSLTRSRGRAKNGLAYAPRERVMAISAHAGADEQVSSRSRRRNEFVQPNRIAGHNTLTQLTRSPTTTGY